MGNKMCGKFDTLFKTILLIMIMFFLTGDCFAEVKLRTEAEAAAYADSITGFGNIKGITKTFKRVVVTDDNTPFLHKQIKGRNVWLAEYKDFKLEIFTISTEDPYNRNFKIYIDADDGTLLKITSKYEGYDPNIFPEPNAVSAEKQLTNVGREKYVGFPKEPPKVNFLKALYASFGGPYSAKEIDAIYVWDSRMGNEPRRVWVITLRGLPPQEFPQPYLSSGIPKQPPVWQRNHMRDVIDADTGKALFSSNGPHPEDPNITKNEKNIKGAKNN